MIKKRTLHILITIASIAVSTALLLLPDPAAGYIAWFCPVLFFAVLTGILCGFFPAFLTGALPCFLAFVIQNFSLQGFDYTVYVPMAVYAVSGIMAAAVYGALKTSIGASVSAVLAGSFVLGLSRFLIWHFNGRTYTIGMFLREGFLEVYPGLLTAVILIPVLIALFRRRGIMKLLRGEKAPI